MNDRYYRLFMLVTLGCVLSVLAVSARADERIDLTEQAREAYRLGDYARSLQLYTQAGKDLQQIPELEFNKGDAQLRLGKMEEAQERFQSATLSENGSTASAAYYNLGNMLLQQEDFPAAVEQYKRSLEFDPENISAKRNLELALKRQSENQQQQESDDQDGDEDSEDESSDQPGQENKQDQQDNNDSDEQEEQNEQEEQKQPEQNPEPDSTQDGSNNQSKPPDPTEMSKEDAERLLNALKDEEMEQQRGKRLFLSSPYTGKKW